MDTHLPAGSAMQSHHSELPFLDVSRIKPKKVKKFLRDNGLSGPDDFIDFHSVCFDPSNSSEYSYHTRTYTFNRNIDEMWEVYKTIHPNESNGKMISFALGYCKNSKQVIYQEDHYPGVEVGQVMILNLNIFNLSSIVVAHEVKEVNEEAKCIRLSYMKQGKARGSQWFRLTRLSDTETEVKHETYYKSNSFIRDKFFYPLVHGMIISEFHHSIYKKAGRAI